MRRVPALRCDRAKRVGGRDLALKFLPDFARDYSRRARVRGVAQRDLDLRKEYLGFAGR